MKPTLRRAGRLIRRALAWRRCFLRLRCFVWRFFACLAVVVTALEVAKQPTVCRVT